MTSAEQIARLDAALAHFPVAYAFIGGGVLSLLVTDPSASAVRVTKDVDVITDTGSRRDYLRLERPLSERFARYLVARDIEAAVEGFVQTDPSPDARMAAIVARFREVAALNPASATP